MHINTGIAICSVLSTPEVQYRVRVDCRLQADCCGTEIDHGGEKRIKTVQDLISVVKHAECFDFAQTVVPDGSKYLERKRAVTVSMDIPWIEQTLRKAIDNPRQQRNDNYIIKAPSRFYISDESLPRFAIFMVPTPTAEYLLEYMITSTPVAGELYDVTTDEGFVGTFLYEAPVFE